jgi:hypothetical protein
MERDSISPRAAWSLAEISSLTGLSVGYLRNEQRAGRLPVKRFGRRVVVLDQDLQVYLKRGSERKPDSDLQSAA